LRVISILNFKIQSDYRHFGLISLALAIFTSFLHLFYLLVTTIFFRTALMDCNVKVVGAQIAFRQLNLKRVASIKPTKWTSKYESERQNPDVKQVFKRIRHAFEWSLEYGR